jgi:hypothetical protein
MLNEKLKRFEEPKSVTGLWLADARQKAIEKARYVREMTPSGGEERGVFKVAQSFYVQMANDYAGRLAKMDETLLNALRGLWSAYVADLKNRYPAKDGEKWAFTCAHHKRIDALLRTE